MIVVVDASVAAMWFLPEVHSPQAALLLTPEYDLVAPDIIKTEVGSALLKALRRNEITAEEGNESLYLLSIAAVRMLPAVEHVKAAFRIAERHGGSLYDAIYISVARGLDAPVVTNDTRLADVARSAGVRAALIATGPPSPEFSG